jgi:hypothetical protein
LHLRSAFSTAKVLSCESRGFENKELYLLA